MRYLILIAIALLTAGAYQKKQELKLELGSRLPAKEVPKNNRELYMTHSGQLRPYIRREVNGVTYVLAYDEKTRKITYLSTHDERFKSSNGLSRGDFMEIKGSEVQIYPGWEIRAPEGEDGWQPLIGFNSEMTILSDQKETKLRLELGQYSLPAERTYQIKIIGFAKGQN